MGETKPHPFAKPVPGFFRSLRQDHLQVECALVALKAEISPPSCPTAQKCRGNILMKRRREQGCIYRGMEILFGDYPVIKMIR